MDSTTPLRNNATGNIQTFVPISGDKFTPLEAHYLALYRVDGNGCWIFQGTILSTGYGSAGGLGLAHRVFYRLLVGPIPAGLVIDHLCRVTACVNPAHLEPVTQAENIRRAVGHSSTLNAAKTHCPQGHEYTAENTRISSKRGGPGAGRGCRICERASWRKWYARTGRPGRKAASNG